MNETKQPSYVIPGAIVVAGIIVAGAIIISSNGDKKDVSSNSENPTAANNSLSAENIIPVSSSDHILGNPNAEVFVVEFSDLECPFCKNFHQTMNQIIDEYGKSGNVAWVYRHFPLAQLHPKAPREAEASECAAELGGNDAFWKYTNQIFNETPSNNGLDQARLPEIAEEIGLDRNSFGECLESGRTQKIVQKHYEDAIKSGGQGTPYSVIITKQGGVFPFSGALPFESVKNLIDQAIRN